jgi:hypothetical protein
MALDRPREERLYTLIELFAQSGIDRSPAVEEGHPDPAPPRAL